MDLDPILLRTFVAVTESGGFTRAAERLHLTQSAVSHQIRRLEEQLGCSLLHRTTRRLTLTEDGEDFLRHAEQILQSLDALSRRFQPSPITGVVRFGVPENFIGDRLPNLLCQFTRAFPAVRMDISVSMSMDLRQMVDADELDLAVVVALPDSTADTVLRRTRFVWVASETFDVAPGRSLPFAFFPSPCINRQIGVSALDGTDVEWHVMFTSPSPQGLNAAISAGLGITVMIEDDVLPGMRIVDGQYGLPSLPPAEFVLLRRPGGCTPAVAEFGKLVLELP
ncbi:MULTISPECIES: LysR family transcriptional regulator [unclassified Lysobacter]|uniref:LysR family transcriptional regulator n=1 Tax=unclassified Lysobacter TaxID=2635362 RepID=UPI001BECA2BD|nr:MULTISPECIES: LysR family transcriptional regulator [unclassified Lysobacter]MBT2745546.1 LysR family transcriptional regulator [Lysobacter sp. ISL-42]MBT2753485.1 LysR family transcriptional regulator [Lysobacter sp. ISL-50]MBT2777131.1 LysR family transcriptional regulator [Lysobacter sp. ISL-54]MBT2780243.1 LysR family transcriptional regulator [Lysobacter sp. ISL-52]